MINLSYCWRMPVIGSSAIAESCLYLITAKVLCVKLNFEHESALYGSYPHLQFNTIYL